MKFDTKQLGMLGLAGSVVGGGIDYFMLQKQLKDQQKKQEGVDANVAKGYSDLKANKYKQSQATRDAAMLGLQDADTSGLDTGLSTLMGGMDQRTLQGSDLLKQYNEGVQGARNTALGFEKEAMQGLAANQESIDRSNVDLDRSVDTMKLQGALANQQQLGQNMAGLEAQKAGIIPGAVGNIMGFLPSLTEEAENGGRVRYDEGGLVAPVGQGKTLTDSIREQQALLHQIMASDQGKDTEDEQPGKDEVPSEENGGRVRYAEGGQMPPELLRQIMAENKGGGQPVVQKTEGEENHDTNKKAIVDEETGEKEAEATGGEYIINSEQGEAIKGQYEAIAQMIQEGEEPSLEDLQSLYDAVHEVFSQPQFNEA
tara:strand:- start:427 stop:1536 length:1110 start_codon:yes stop_codon:yes gene_type:complete